MNIYFDIEVEITCIQRHRYRVTAPNEAIAKALMVQTFDEVAGTESGPVQISESPSKRVVYLNSEIVPESIELVETTDRPSMKLICDEKTLKDNYRQTAIIP